MATPATAPPDTPDFEGLGTPVPGGGNRGADVVVENVIPSGGTAVELAAMGQMNVGMVPFQATGQVITLVAPKGQITTVGASGIAVCVSHFCSVDGAGAIGEGVLSLGAVLAGIEGVAISALFIWAAIPK